MKQILNAPLLLLILVSTFTSHAEEVYVPIDQSQTGSLYVDAVINSSVHSRFLVDTGAGMVTLNRDLFQEIARAGKVEEIGEIVARLANGKLQTLPLYRVESFSIGNNCQLGEMEVAVINSSGHNILGLSALIMVAPFSVNVSPLELVLSGCKQNGPSVASSS